MQRAIWKFKVRHSDAGHWLVSGITIGSPGDAEWVGVWDSSTGALTESTKLAWDTCKTTPVTLDQLYTQMGADVVRLRESRLWIEGLRSKEVRSETTVDMERGLRKGVAKWCQRVIVMGTSASRHRVVDKVTLPPMATPHYYFSEPKILRVQAFALPDLKPIGAVVELKDAQLMLPDRGSNDGCNDNADMYSAEGFPGILIVGGRREMWIVNLDQLNGDKP